jgi:hypothetical protein
MVDPDDRCDRANPKHDVLEIESHVDAPNNPCEITTSWANQVVTVINHRLHPVRIKICCESNNGCSEYESSGCYHEFEKISPGASIGKESSTYESFKLKRIDQTSHSDDVISTWVEYRLDADQSTYDEGPDVDLEVDII